MAHHLKRAHELLGADADSTSFVIVSVDPQRDTIERAREYVQAWGMATEWSYLVGTEDELAQVWGDYYVSPSLDETAGASDVPEEWKVGPPPAGVEALRRDVVSRYTVSHQAPVYVIDKRGRLRALHSLPIDPADIASDVVTLLSER